jgi:hypothetical protein
MKNKGIGMHIVIVICIGVLSVGILLAMHAGEALSPQLTSLKNHLNTLDTVARSDDQQTARDIQIVTDRIYALVIHCYDQYSVIVGYHATGEHLHRMTITYESITTLIRSIKKQPTADKITQLRRLLWEFENLCRDVI